MRNTKLLKGMSTVAFVVMIAVNAMANLLPINNLTTGEVSDLYPSLFTPAGITFSIWSVIYLLLTGFVVFVWTTDKTGVIALLPAFILSCLVNSTWILVWHFLLPAVSVLIMLGLLVVTGYLFIKSRRFGANTMMEQVVFILPFTLYFAWISVATIANISALLVDLDWQGGTISPELWTALMMAVAATLAIKIMFDFNAPAFGLVVVWALTGIFLRWHGSDYLTIVYTSIVLAAVLFLVVLYNFFRRTSA